MERRQTAERRKIHMFVSEERRTGPHERRGADARRRESAREREKIARIRAFKEKDKVSVPARPLITRKRLLFVGLGLLIIIGILFIRN